MFDVLGILVGHIYFYLEDIYARYWDRRLLKTPGILYVVQRAPAINHRMH
jgi:hypothetical protein